MIEVRSCLITENVLAYPPNVMRMTFEFPGEVKPGQFVNVRVSDNLDPVLRRPFSVHDSDGRTISILYMIVGRGTELMAEMTPGSTVSVAAPLGNGFPTEVMAKRAILISGGCGTAPMYLLSKSLGCPTEIMIGGRKKENLLCLDLFPEAKTTTEDGSHGEKGFVTKLLEESLAADKDAVVYSCGPNLMMKAVAEIAAKYGAECYVSLENKMACGIGVCMGCVQMMKDGKYARVCKEGPVFDGEEIAWQG
ncbi:MAG: dihydroorotate dehydrogenase electron transfer subunit [Abditibacteriota bacterium]|nr:dihydroorotate dehydrogenase electron transfer subunit [Abditibacteriota bacterium]